MKKLALGGLAGDAGDGVAFAVLVAAVGGIAALYGGKTWRSGNRRVRGSTRTAAKNRYPA